MESSLIEYEQIHAGLDRDEVIVLLNFMRCIGDMLRMFPNDTSGPFTISEVISQMERTKEKLSEKLSEKDANSLDDVRFALWLSPKLISFGHARLTFTNLDRWQYGLVFNARVLTYNDTTGLGDAIENYQDFYLVIRHNERYAKFETNIVMGLGKSDKSEYECDSHVLKHSISFPVLISILEKALENKEEKP